MGRLILAFVAALAIGALWWLAGHQGEPGGSQAIRAPAMDLPLTLPTDPFEDASGMAVPTGASGSRVGAPFEERDVSSESEGAQAAHPWEGQFSGVQGRLLEADGAPAAGLTVTLLAASSDLLMDPALVARPYGSLDVGQSITAADGTFSIAGAVSSHLHALGVDLMGPRAWARVLEESLAPGAVTDLGDIVLDPLGTVVGTVIDEDGEPIQGARVRLAAVPDLFAEFGLFEVTPDASLGSPEGSSMIVTALPEFVRALVDRLPAPTVETDAEGRFVFAGAPVGRVLGGVDQPGLAVTVIPGFEVVRGATHDLDEIELLPGRVAEGRVIDGAGRGVAGAEVIAGTMRPALEVALLKPAEPTGPDGAFRAAGLSELGDIVVAARRTPRDPWVSVVSPRAAKGLRIQLPGVSDLGVTVLDAGTGEPVSGATIDLQPVRVASPFSIAEQLRLMSAPRPPDARGRVEIEPGRYSVRGVPHGSWVVTAGAPGWAATTLQVEHGPAVSQHRIELVRGESLVFRVTDGNSREPLARAHVALVASRGVSPVTLGAGFTDGEGLVTIGPVGPQAEVAGTYRYTLDPEGARVVIQHPEVGRSATPYPGPRLDSGESASEEPIELVVVRAATVSGRVTWAGESPGKRYALLAIPGDDASLDLPRFALSDAEGRYILTGVAAGSYRLEVAERFLNGSPFEVLAAGPTGTRAVHGEALRVDGRDQTVDIDLQSDGAARLSWLEGDVTLNGAPVAGARVQVNYSAEPRILTDAMGRFRTPDMDAGRYVLSVALPADAAFVEEADEGEFHEVWNGILTVDSGKSAGVSVSLSTRDVEFLVLGAEEESPLEGATIRDDFGFSWTTDERGRATAALRLVREEYHDTAGYSVDEDSMAVTVSVSGRETQRIPRSRLQSDFCEVRLPATTPFAGTVRLPNDASPETGADTYFFLEAVGSSGERRDWIRFAPDTLQFRHEGLRPGTYRATYGAALESGVTIEFDLPEAGAVDLMLDFSQG